jgi:predicted nucleic acid-binding protein
MVIADTSVWVPFFNHPESDEKQAMDALIDGRQLALVGMVLAELLQGCRTPKETETILSKLTGLPFLEMGFSNWRRTGELSASLRRKGVTIPLSDLVIAALALDHRCQVYALDPHFTRIPGLSLYRPRKRPSRRV